MTIINETGLYILILRSSKPVAKAFKRWLTHDVIQSIRSTVWLPD
jgi:prophage antirepressor-like protein